MKTALLFVFSAGLVAAEQPKVRAALEPAPTRQETPGFVLKDGAGRSVQLKQFRGKVVVLDFWATWCHGCKEEIPWFAEFQRKYGSKGLVVLGVSLDEEGWKVLKPFVESTKIPYRIVLGDEAIAKQYAIENMPKTVLIDRRGRTGATYTGLVDRADVEANLKAMLAER
jgi:thiol-disulfide isomerase/thioredoxin